MRAPSAIPPVIWIWRSQTWQRFLRRACNMKRIFYYLYASATLSFSFAWAKLRRIFKLWHISGIKKDWQHFWCCQFFCSRERDFFSQNAIGPWPMQLVVPSAVSAAVKMDITIWITVFQVSRFILLSFLFQFLPQITQILQIFIYRCRVVAQL